jgi:hypothetical protein
MRLRGGGSFPRRGGLPCVDHSDVDQLNVARSTYREEDDRQQRQQLGCHRYLPSKVRPTASRERGKVDTCSRHDR